MMFAARGAAYQHLAAAPYGRLLRCVLSCCLVLMLGAPALAATYFVEAGADGANNGSKAAPFATISQAAAIARAGDTVHVAAGVYDESVVLERYGSHDAPIAVIGRDRPVVRGGSAAGFSIAGDFVTVQGFEIAGGVFGAYVTGSNVTLLDNVIHHNEHDGVRVDGAMDVRILGGEIFDNGPGNGVGVWLSGMVLDLVVEDVEIYSTGIQKTAVNAYEAADSNGIILRNVTVRDHPEYGVSLMAAPPGTLTDIRIIGCTFENNGYGAVHSIGDFSYRLGNVLIQRATRGLIEQSVFAGGPGWGMDCYTSDRLEIRNNLFINNVDAGDPAVGPGIGLEVNAGQDNMILHNVFYGNDVGLFTSYIDSGGPWPPGPAFAVVQNNIFWNNRVDMEMTEEGDPPLTVVQGANLAGTDPRFADAQGRDFHLEQGSPAIDTGVDIGVDDDFFGNPRPQGAAPDIGAHEYPHE